MTTKGKGYSVDFPNPQQVSKDLVREVMPGLVEVVADKARDLVPTQSGKLKNSIEGRTEQGGLRGAVAARARHAHLVHEGTAGHPIPVRQARALVIRSGGQYLIRASAQYPGTRRQPFLTDALKQSEGEISRALSGEGPLRKAVGG